MTINFFTVNVGPKNGPTITPNRCPLPIKININKLEKVIETWRLRYPYAEFRVSETRRHGMPQGSALSAELWIRYQPENRTLRRNEVKHEFDIEAQKHSKKRKIQE